MMGIIATSTAASRHLLSRAVLGPARRARRFQSGSTHRPPPAGRSPAMRRMISASGAHKHECAENKKALAGAPAIGDGAHDRRDQDRAEPLTCLAQAHYRTLLVAADGP